MYWPALQLYHNGFTYVFVDFATGACCFLVMIGLSGWIMRLPPLTRVLAFAGAYSYGIFLVHQPYVIWLGLRIRALPIWAFLLVCVAVLTVMSLWGAALEKAINALVNKLLPKKASA